MAVSEKYVHLAPGSSVGIVLVGQETQIFGAVTFESRGAAEFQVEIEGDWVAMGELAQPRVRTQEGVREMGDGRYAFNFISPKGMYSYRWTCTRHSGEGDIVTYLAS